MELRQIRYFQAVVEQNSFSEAAEVCHISQSNISQQIRALEDELGFQLLERHNRKFSLTPAGKHFYEKSLVLTADLEQMVREAGRIARSEDAELSLGCLNSYGGEEFMRAVAAFSEKYPAVRLKVTTGNHEELYEGLISGRIDLALNDQRRAFFDSYENHILSRSLCMVEVATHHPLAKLDRVEVDDLKNTPCILVASAGQEENERTYYREVVGFRGEMLFAKTLQEARILVTSNRGFLPVEGADAAPWFGSTLKRIPLCRGGEQLVRNYCAFWNKENSGYYIEEFAEMLEAEFAAGDRDSAE
ncbi:MAG: LysR family transcriptional regulator [Lachnospiraceae bacterium]|nr:LysR family transcriptional regulator [Lachnospiraceae bacterium]